VLSIPRDAIPAVFPTHVFGIAWTLWPSGLRRWLKAPFRKGVGSNPTGVIRGHEQHKFAQYRFSICMLEPASTVWSSCLRCISDLTAWREAVLFMQLSRIVVRGDVEVGSSFNYPDKRRRAHPDLNQGPADLQSAALTTELCTQMTPSDFCSERCVPWGSPGASLVGAVLVLHLLTPGRRNRTPACLHAP
jgi:hypothetical protein